MSVDAAEFVGVGGRFNVKAFWPHLSDDDVAALFTAWITGAEEKPEISGLETEDEQDAATRLWVIYRAKDDIYQIRSGNPASVAVDGKGSHGFTQGQIDDAKAEAEAALAEFLDEVAEEEVVEAVPVVRQSASVPISYRF